MNVTGSVKNEQMVMTTQFVQRAVAGPWARATFARVTSSAKHGAKRLLARRGWHVGQSEIDWSLDVYLPRLFEAFDINCVIDVGARVGDYGTLLRRAGYTGQIVSFEPVASNFAVLRQRCASDDGWTAYPYALGSSDEVSSINVMHESSFCSMLRPNDYGEQPFFLGNIVDHQEEIQIRRLDRLFAEITRHIDNPRVYLKMDTQGWDLEVFRGVEGCLPHIVALQSEMSVRPIYHGMPSCDQALTVYRSSGFVESAFFRVNRDQLWRLVEFDCVMVRDADRPSLPTVGETRETAS